MRCRPVLCGGAGRAPISKRCRKRQWYLISMPIPCAADGILRRPAGAQGKDGILGKNAARLCSLCAPAGRMLLLIAFCRQAMAAHTAAG